METLLFFWLSVLFLGSDHVRDPIQAGWQGRAALRDLECERLDQAEAHRRHPAEVPATPMKTSTMMTTDALVCRRMVVPWDDRPGRDGVILALLSEESAAMAGAVVGAVGDVRGGRVAVDVFHPDPRLSQKIAIASRQALAERGLPMSGLAPLLAAGDVDVLTGIPLERALPVGCARLFAEGTLQASDAFIGVALLREDETTLHAGLCREGRWRWLR